MSKTKKNIKKTKKDITVKQKKSTKQIKKAKQTITTKSKKIEKQTKDKSKKEIKNKKNSLLLLIIISIITILIIGICIFYNANKEIENTKKLAIESVKNLEVNEIETIVNISEDMSKYSLQDFSDILEEHGATVNIKSIGGDENKEYKCLIATSKGIYEDFSEDEWATPIVMTIQGYNADEILVSAKRLASDEKIVYCDWYVNGKSYQAICLDVVDISDYLTSIYKYIIETV